MPNTNTIVKLCIYTHDISDSRHSIPYFLCGGLCICKLNSPEALCTSEYVHDKWNGPYRINIP